MNTMLVWVLLTVTYSPNQLAYSPQLADLESCQRIQKAIDVPMRHTQCVQIRVPKETK